MRVLFLGDMVGRTGREAVFASLPELKKRLNADFVIVNGENAAGGFGITEDIFNKTIEAGADVVTTGNHVWDQREALIVADREQQFLRPANYPDGAPGRGVNVFQAANGVRVMVINIMGRVFVHPELDDPFDCIANILQSGGLGEAADVIFVDFHAEATSEKQCFAHFVDGRVSAVIGTHTHVPTADHQILSGGTAFMSDAGMCGDYNSSLGMDKEEPVNRFVTKIPRGRMEPATGEATVCGVIIEINPANGLAVDIQPVRLGGRLSATPHEIQS